MSSLTFNVFFFFGGGGHLSFAFCIVELNQTEKSGKVFNSVVQNDV